MYQSLEGFTVRRGQLPDGDLGVFATVGEMRKLVLHDAEDPDVRQTAYSVIGLGQANSPTDSLRSLFEFVRDSVQFTPDPRGIEQIQSPRFTLRRQAGDCDDKATLLASLVRAARLPVGLRFRVVGLDRAAPGRFSHVFVVARVNGEDVPMDSTYVENAFGWQHSRPSRIADIPV